MAEDATLLVCDVLTALFLVWYTMAVASSSPDEVATRASAPTSVSGSGGIEASRERTPLVGDPAAPAGFRDCVGVVQAGHQSRGARCAPCPHGHRREAGGGRDGVVDGAHP